MFSNSGLAGVNHEEAGEKWRSGDSAKSYRFFQRAIETYDDGLKKHPGSFDLAYNKSIYSISKLIFPDSIRARLQYDVSQQPKLLQHCPTPVLELLSRSLELHRYALNLKQDDSDALLYVTSKRPNQTNKGKKSNTAQVLTSIAEILIESSVTDSQERLDAINLLREAIDIFQKCLSVQESRLLESQMPTSIQEPTGEVPSTANTELPQSEDQWASVVEPLTPSTLLETCVAEIHALTTLVPLLRPDPQIYKEFESHSTDLLNKASELIRRSDIDDSSAFAHARFNLLAAVIDFAFRSAIIQVEEYSENLNSAWTSGPTIQSDDPAPIYDYAEAFVNFNTSLAASNGSGDGNVRWNALQMALDHLKSADSIRGAKNRSAINARRGDVELLRVRLGDPPLSYERSVSNRDTLLKNAETYYEGARKLATVEGDMDMTNDMVAKITIVKGLRDGKSLTAIQGSQEQLKLEGVMNEMREDGLLPH
jgi:hypothetical protein